MNTITVLSPTENLITAIIARLTPAGADYTNNVIVFPGKRPAHVLRKTLADTLQKSYFPPRVFTIDQFIEHLHDELMGKKIPRLEQADALSLLYDIHSGMKEKIGGEHYTRLDAFVPVGLKLVAELEEVAMALVDERKLREIVTAIPFTSYHALSAYYHEFYSAVANHGYVTRSMMYRQVAERINEVELSSFSNVILAGFYALTAAEHKIFTDLRARENVQFLFQDGTGLQQQLEKFSFTMQRKEQPEQNSPDIHFITAPDLHGQVFALAAQFDSRLKESQPVDHRVAIVFPSADALFPLYHNVLSLLPPEEYNIALGYPVTRTPAFGFLISLMELAESELEGTYSSSEYMKLLLHPYTKNIRFKNRSDVTRIMAHSIEEYLADAGMVQVSLENLEQDDELLERILKSVARIDNTITIELLRRHLIAIHDNTVRIFKGFHNVKEFMERAIASLLYIFNHSTAPLHPYFRPYVERLIEALEGISTSLLADKKFEDPSGYFLLLRHLLGGETVPFSGTPLRGLQVLGLLETRNLSFDTLYILDVNDDVLPGKPEADLLLPQQVRLQLGLETYREREKLSEYYFNLAVAGAKEVFCFYTQSESGKKERSRFIEKLLWQFQQKDKTISVENYEQRAKYRVYLANDRPPPVAKTDEMVRRMKQYLRFGATALDTYNACQLKFYYRYVLRLDVKDEATDDVDSLLVGTVVHDILAEYFKPCIGNTLTKEMLSVERLHTVIEERFLKQFGDRAPGTVVLFKQKTIEHLTEFLEKYQLPLIERENVVIVDVERSIQIEKRGCTFAGRIDRVEMRGGQTYILDYKTGSSENRVRIRTDKLILDDRSTWSEAIQSFQLPMYMLMYHELTQKGIETIMPAYLFLGKKNLENDIEAGIGNELESPSEVYQKVEAVIFKIIQEILDINHEFTATPELDDHCPRCPYSALCGTQWVGTGWEG